MTGKGLAVLFDLDGVLFDTKKNMKYSWDLTSKRFDLKVPFKNYYQFIGRPFRDILRLLKIKKNFSSIKKSFSDISKKNLHKIKIYPNVRKVLSYLKKKNIKIGIVTSKDKFRTKKILQKFNIKINDNIYEYQLLKKGNLIQLGDSSKIFQRYYGKI